MSMNRRKTKKISAGGIEIGGGAPVSIQSMTNTDTRNVKATADQINALAEAGCDIVRMAVFDEDCVRAIKDIKKQVKVPLVADIHFDYRLAIGAIENGIDKLRINPGNIGSADRVRAVAQCAKAHGVPIRVGVNAGSLDKNIMAKFGRTAEAMAESALLHAGMLEAEGFNDIVLSVKCSDVTMMCEAYRLLAEKTDYPMHLGVTEAGSGEMAVVKSSIGIGSLLMEGIGDTIRVSITGDPLQEAFVAKDILTVLGLKDGVQIISCPTCGRNCVPIAPIAEEIKRRTAGIDKRLKIAIMGCVVNGPGEAADADIGMAAGKDSGVIFIKGQRVKTVPADNIINELMTEIDKMI